MSETPTQSELQNPPPQESTEPYYAYPGQRPVAPPPRKRNGAGCWIVGLLTAFMATALIIAGLFLPPVNLADRLFGEQYAMLSSQNNAAASGNFTLIVDPDNPGNDFGVRLASVSRSDFEAGRDSAGPWVTQARASLPAFLAPQSQVYIIERKGTAPDTVTLTIELPADAANPDVLDLYAWDDRTDTWDFVPSHLTSNGLLRATVDRVPEKIALFQAIPFDPIVLSTLNYSEAIHQDIADLLTILSPVGVQPSLPTIQQQQSGNEQTLAGSLAPGFELNAGYLVMPVIRNFADPRATDVDTVIALISNRSLRDRHIQQITSFASSGGYSGVFIDYRDLPADQRGNFSAFIRELGRSLKNMNLSLGVVVPPAENIEGRWETGGYEWRSLGAHADYVQINLGPNPTTFEPGTDRLVEAMLRWAVGEVSRYKLLGGMSALSIRQIQDDFTPVGFDEALSALGNVTINVEERDSDTVLPGTEITIGLDGYEALPGVEQSIQAPFVEYLAPDGTSISRMWLATGDALRFRLDRFTPFGMAGVAFSDLLSRGVIENINDVLLSYKMQLPSAASEQELVLNWRIESAVGRIAEFTTGFNEELVVTLEAPDGNYAVNVEVVGGSASSARGGAAVALFAPTPTPTPLPTSTPRPTPTPTPTLAPVQPTAASQQQAAPPPAGPAPVNPGAGSIALGSFEYGGHVANPSSDRTINAMRSAGMSWKKVQVRYGLGANAGSVAGTIESMRAGGFKVLLGVVGSPSELAAGGGDYIRQFAQYVGDLAALGPDAIEIWNEPNLDREWPTGQISGANYTALLRESYNAIKSRNGSVMVIAGAPAPTGAENAFPGQVVNDDNFVRQMMDAGAINFMDCMGMHYNEGLVSARQTSGDPRDNYYTRYLPTMIDRYWNLIGGQKPICITELGYLTPEGYPPLPGFFSWAQNVTVAQQAAWLAEAAAVASQSGRVRLMIVWNIDFTRYDADPMAGYAIIRPDGSCPACSALAAAR